MNKGENKVDEQDKAAIDAAYNDYAIKMAKERCSVIWVDFQVGAKAMLKHVRGKQEPVHFRAVICKEQRERSLGAVPRIVGFVDKKAAEQFILEKRDFQGWRYELEPLYPEAPAVAVNEQLLLELKELVRAYVRLLQAGKDRIESLGGDCDPVDRMESSDSNLRSAKAAIAAAEAAKGV